MALVLYSDLYWYPTGMIAANLPAAVFPHHSNAFAPIFSDSAGTPLANPASTDGTGTLTFWAEEGKYWVHIDTEAFLIDVGLSEEEADLSTGVASGGELSPSLVNPQAVTIGSLVGYVVDNNDLLSVVPTVTKVDEALQTVVLDGPAQARALTWWLMDSAGAVIQQAFPPPPDQRRSHIALGVSLYDPGVNAIVDVQSQPVILGQPANQFADTLDSMGPIRLDGNEITFVPGSLGFNLSAGTVFSRGLNHFNTGVLTNSPHINATPGRSPAMFKRVIRVAESPLPPDVFTVDPTRYDLNGVLTLVGGGPNTSTVVRIFVIPNGSPSAQVAVQYGQQTFSSLSAAVGVIGTANFIPNPLSTFGALIGYIAVTRVATDLTDPVQAVFVRPNSKLPTY